MNLSNNYSRKIKKKPLKNSQKAGFKMVTSFGLLKKLFPKMTEQGAKTLGEVTSKGLRETFNVGKNVIQGFTNDQKKHLINQVKETETHKLLNTCMKDQTTASHNFQKIAIAIGGFLGMFQSVGIGKVLGQGEEKKKYQNDRKLFLEYQEKLKKAEQHLQETEENLKRQLKFSKLTKNREESLYRELDGVKKELKKIQDENTQLSQDILSKSELNSVLKEKETKLNDKLVKLMTTIDEKSRDENSYFSLYQESQEHMEDLKRQNQDLKTRIDEKSTDENSYFSLYQESQKHMEDLKRQNQDEKNGLSQKITGLVQEINFHKTMIEKEKQKNMLLLAPPIGIPLIIGGLKLYKYLKNRVDKSSPKISPKKDDQNQSISISKARKILQQFKNEFYKLYSSKFVDKLFSTVNYIIDNNKLYYSLISTLIIINVYKFSKLKKF